jgi:hypothetical protein
VRFDIAAQRRNQSFQFVAKFARASPRPSAQGAPPLTRARWISRPNLPNRSLATDASFKLHISKSAAAGLRSLACASTSLRRLLHQIAKRSLPPQRSEAFSDQPQRINSAIHCHLSRRSSCPARS